jgi:uncharacterized protein
MKKLLLLFLVVLHANVFAQKSIPKPNPVRLVNDYAQVLNAYDADMLEKKLVALDDSTSNQIVVLIVPSINGEVIEDVAVKTFRDWGIGNKKTNNGVLLLVAIQDRKVRIEVGYGLEGAIPDVVANDIINRDIKPAFKQGNYIGGITTAVDNLSKAAAGEYKVKRSKSKGDGNGSILGIIIIIVIVILLAGGRGRGGRGGGGSLIGPMILSSMLSGGGGGSSSGGGFGGFGGGSSGGGGASGDW